jgi:hypothetical protein
MSVHAAIRRAEQLLPGEAAAEGEDPRWQAIIGVGKHIEMRPEVVWGFVRKWGCHTDNDLRQAVATPA